MSKDFSCKFRQSISVIPMILCITCNMNTKSKDFIIIKTPFASPQISSVDPSRVIFSSTCIVAQYISITLQIESK
ncbi:hypothetical protein Sjap_025536 [Stephania japonica]|uniref:Uncharacterized protein n=1 Tax=Stephania japonica TaxID=461633 RepID=A0AAP0HJN3_9MAGN